MKIPVFFYEPQILSEQRGGFTLIELLTVIAIIGILAAILIPVTTAPIGLLTMVEDPIGSSATIMADGAIDFVAEDNLLYALDADGALRWAYAFSEQFAHFSSHRSSRESLFWRIKWCLLCC